MKILVAGAGNLLRGDDGVGVTVAARLAAGAVPPGVRIFDVGIGGIHLVQELMDPVDALIVVDAVEMGRPPGTVLVVRPDVLDVAGLPLTERHDQLADMHYSTPERAFMLARGLGLLPESTWLVGCQAEDAHSWGEGLSPAVSAAVGVASDEVRRLVTELGVPWV